MVNEVITARIGSTDPENVPALAGFGPLPPSRRPLADVAGRPLLPRIIRALRAGLKPPSPAALIAAHGPTVPAAGANNPAIDPQRLAVFEDSARRLHTYASAKYLAHGARRLGGVAMLLGRGVLGLLRGALRTLLAASDLEPSTPFGNPGVLDVPPDYETRRARFYSRGL